MAEKNAKQPQKGGQPQKGSQPQPQGKATRPQAVKNAVQIQEPGERTPAPPARLRLKYKGEVVDALMKQFNYKNVMQVPSLKKVVVNVGLGEAIANAKALDAALNDLTAIVGQKPMVNRAKKSIAAFKVREGMPVGISVTLRGARMYEFLDRLINVALPRVRDFSGVPKRFDGHGNFTLGLKEQIIFPEIDYDKVDKVRGMEVTIVTSAKNDEEGQQLIRLLGMPFRK
ncbi:MAG: ribosomal protein [Chloroflexi bacterium]|nr:ribosomal protein [Chloroflexota bacterium]